MEGQSRDRTGSGDALPVLVVSLLKGAVYQENDPGLWNLLLNLQARIRDYVAVMGLDLILDESEGYAFLRARLLAEDNVTDNLPRLIARRPLSFPVSLILALLRKKLAEFDAAGGDTRLVLNGEEIVDLVRVFLPDGTNETKVIDQIEANLNKVVELGFLRRLKPTASTTGTTSGFEVRRILKAFVDAQWLADFDAHLAAYQAELGLTPERSTHA